MTDIIDDACTALGWHLKNMRLVCPRERRLLRPPPIPAGWLKRPLERPADFWVGTSGRTFLRPDTTWNVLHAKATGDWAAFDEGHDETSNGVFYEWNVHLWFEREEDANLYMDFAFFRGRRFVVLNRDSGRVVYRGSDEGEAFRLKMVKEGDIQVMERRG